MFPGKAMFKIEYDDETKSKSLIASSIVILLSRTVSFQIAFPIS